MSTISSTGQKLALTQVLHAPLVSPKGDRLGRVEDLIVRLADGGYPPVTGLKVTVGGRDLFVPANLIESLEPGRVTLAGQTLNLGRFERRPGEVLLKEDVQDRRMINVSAGRLVNANDLILERIGDSWRLVAVDVSPRGVLRRFLPGMRREPVNLAGVVDWKEIQPFVGHVPTAGLLMPLGPLRRLHPAQIADLVEDASHEEGEEIIDAVEADPELTADVFEELDPDHQKEFLKERSNEEAAALLDRMEPDDAVDMLAELDQDRRVAVLQLVEPSQQQKIRNLLKYNPGTAGGMMSPDFIAVTPGTTAAAALDRVRKDETTPETLLSAIFVVDEEGRLVGSVNTVDLLRVPPDQPVETLELLQTDAVTVGADLPDVAIKMTDYNLTALPVVDRDRKLVGAISVDDILEAMIPDDWRRRADSEG